MKSTSVENIISVKFIQLVFTGYKVMANVYCYTEEFILNVNGKICLSFRTLSLLSFFLQNRYTKTKIGRYVLFKTIFSD